MAAILSRHTAPDALASRAGITFARILVPVDFSPGSQRAVATALSLRQSFGSDVHLFHLVERPEDETLLVGDVNDAGALVVNAESRLLRFVEMSFPEVADRIAVHARIGRDVVEGIGRAARDTRATLVVLAARPRQSVLRTQVEKVVRGLDCGVMVLWTPDAGMPS